MSLLALQRDMRDHLLNGAGMSAQRMHGDATAGLAVYHNAYRGQLVDCLRDTFEKVAAWLGDDAFEDAARAYVEANPPRSWTLSDYGERFGATLATIYPDDPEVAELAWLDWTLRRAFEAADCDPLEVAALADIDWDQAVFSFVPTLTLNLVQTNCAAIWSALATGTMPPPAERLSSATTIRVWRAGLSPQFKSIAPTEARALQLAIMDLSFGEICKLAIEEADECDAVQAASQLLSAWISDGIIVGIQ
ncbi:MAG TPA: DNA-binding domain-containing protein [Caulobacteraceae bacterium]|jgi:hypothetical protein